jgi:hypothetical protein
VPAATCACCPLLLGAATQHAGLLSADETNNENIGTISEYASAKDNHVTTTTHLSGSASNTLAASGHGSSVSNNDNIEAKEVLVGITSGVGVQSVKTGDKTTRIGYVPKPRASRPQKRGELVLGVTALPLQLGVALCAVAAAALGGGSCAGRRQLR